MAKANKFDPKVRAARKKKQAIVLAFVFIVAVGSQMPRYMKMLSGGDAAPTSRSASATGTSGTSDTTGTSTPTADASGAEALPVAATSSSSDALVVQADLAPAPLEGQLGDFTLFDAKDPFKQRQVGGTRPVGTPSSTAPAGNVKFGSAAAKLPAGVGAVSTSPTAGTSTQPTTTAPPPAPTAATISVNGVQETVNVAADFPAAAPLFHLVKLSAKTAEISIAGGSLASGSPTVTLKLGKPLTLMNTADGTRFVLVLVNTSASATAAATTATAPTP